MSVNLHHNNYKLMLQEEKTLRMLAESDLKDAVEMMEFYGEQLMSIKAENAILKQEILNLKRKVC